jgi:hypothetical protein
MSDCSRMAVISSESGRRGVRNSSSLFQLATQPQRPADGHTLAGHPGAAGEDRGNPVPALPPSGLTTGITELSPPEVFPASTQQDTAGRSFPLSPVTLPVATEWASASRGLPPEPRARRDPPGPQDRADHGCVSGGTACSARATTSLYTLAFDLINRCYFQRR